MLYKVKIKISYLIKKIKDMDLFTAVKVVDLTTVAE